MNPFDLSASDMMIWGLVLHLIADWPLQSEWMAMNKMKRRETWTRTKLNSPGEYAGTVSTRNSPSWWDRHPAAYVHSGIHTLLLALVFGWAAIFIGVLHLIIDCRWVVERWSMVFGQTQPKQDRAFLAKRGPISTMSATVDLYDIGAEVRIWTDQVFHIAVIAVAALLVHI